MSPDLPIGVFDSGVGGLTVLRALRRALPGERLLYLGDTARLPYGTRSDATVIRYARQAARVLVDRGVKLLVVACNTASAVALDDLRRHFAPLPLVGVVGPGAEAACAATRSGAIAVLGTESTISGGAYDRAITSRRPDARVIGRACQLFVALSEEGWTEGPVPEAVARRYLGGLMDEHGADTMVLGCTHFPVLRGVISSVVGEAVTIVDSAQTTAKAVARELGRLELLIAPGGAGDLIKLMATDAPQRFARVGAGFLGQSIDAEDVELVDLVG